MLVTQCSDNELRYICNFCFDKIRYDVMPSICVFNNLQIQDVPEEILCLNDFEKMIIQRAKCFQSIHKMTTVMGKNLPNKVVLPKIVGRVVHLPLPIEETVKKICNDCEPINLNHEIYILVRSIPNKNNVIWEKLVNINKVFNALKWLRDNNELYSKINLPDSLEKLQNLLNKAPTVEFEDCEIEEEQDKMKVKSDRSNLILEEDEKQKRKEKDIDLDDKKCDAMLTLVSQSNPFYEHYTIYPLQESRINETATNIYQQIKIHEMPLNRTLQIIDLLCFPDLFPYGINGQNCYRPVRLRDCDFIKTVLMSKDPRYRRNKQYIFYLLNNCTMRQLDGGIFQTINIVNPTLVYTKKQFLDNLKKGKLESNLNNIFSRLRNTQQFWKKSMCDLNAMIFHYGPATWFLTVSPSEWKNSQLIQYVKDMNQDIDTSKMSTNEIIALDPVSVSRFMDIQFHALLSAICTKDGPLGNVTHYFWRREYQQRGMVHFHILIWIDNAPVLGQSSNSEIADFIQNYVSCGLPDKKISPMLYEQVTKNQIHHHNDYCMRTKKKGTAFKKICRFGFPRPEKEMFELSTVQKSVCGRRNLNSNSRLYYLPRNKDEVFINDYSPAILLDWCGNMDLQYVGDKSTALTIYLTKYILKAEKTAFENVLENIQMNKNFFSVLWNIGMRMLTHRECGLIEAVDTCLGFSLCGYDRDTVIRWLNVFMVRDKKLKSIKDLKLIDDDSTDIFYESFVDTYYPNRPEELNFMNLYDFASWYDVQNNEPKRKNVEYFQYENGKYLKKRNKKYIINHYRFKVDSQPEAYFYSLLLLFKPWRNVDELNFGFTTYKEAFFNFNNPDAISYHEKIIGKNFDLEEMKKLIEEENLKQNAKENSEDPNNDIDAVLHSVPDETENAMADFKNVVEMIEKDDSFDWKNALNTANADQLKVYNTLIDHVNSADKICRLFVTGEAGTGKSILIKIISYAIKDLYKKDVAIVAPTGIAAFNINGLTIHNLFQLPVEHGRTPPYAPLSDSKLKFIRNQMRNVEVIIVDEISMVSNVTLLYLHLRLVEIFNTFGEDGYFGKKHIVVFGDLLQLPPVNEGQVFEKIDKRTLLKYVPSLGTFNLWSLFKYDELTINMRQKNDNCLRNLLANIRLGLVIPADVEILNKRRINFISTNITDRLNEFCELLINKLPKDTVCLLPTNDMCNTLNEAMLRKNINDEILLVANDIVDTRVHYLRNRALKQLEKNDENITKTAGLSKVIKIKINASVMIRRNIDITKGLVNGTICTLESVSRNFINGEIETINVRLKNNEVVKIEKVKVKFEINKGVMVTREQFPIMLSYAITVHKSQGLSLENIIVDAGEVNFACGQIYVGLSRVTKLEGLHLINFDPSKILANERAIAEYNRLRTLYRPDLQIYKTSEIRGCKQIDRIWTVPKHVLQAQNNCLESTNFETWVIKKLPNSNNILDYVNVSVQLLFHNSFIRNKIISFSKKDLLKNIFNEYRNSQIKDLFKLGKYVGDDYVSNSKHDFIKFFNSLLLKSNYIRDLFLYKLAIIFKCNTCDNSILENITDNIILNLDLLDLKSYSLEMIFNLNFNESINTKFHCNYCNKSMNGIMKKRIIMCNNLLMFCVVLNSYDDKHKKIDTSSLKIQSVTNFKTTILEKNYQIISAIFLENNHYVCLLRNEQNKWTYVNDDKVIKNKAWPRNSRNVHIFLLEEKRKKK